MLLFIHHTCITKWLLWKILMTVQYTLFWKHGRFALGLWWLYLLLISVMFTVQCAQNCLLMWSSWMKTHIPQRKQNLLFLQHIYMHFISGISQNCNNFLLWSELKLIYKLPTTTSPYFIKEYNRHSKLIRQLVHQYVYWQYKTSF